MTKAKLSPSLHLRTPRPINTSKLSWKAIKIRKKYYSYNQMLNKTMRSTWLESVRIWTKTKTLMIRLLNSALRLKELRKKFSWRRCSEFPIVTPLWAMIMEMKTCRVRMTSQPLRIKMKSKMRIKMNKVVRLKNPLANVARPQWKERRSQKKKQQKDYW